MDSGTGQWLHHVLCCFSFKLNPKKRLVMNEDVAIEENRSSPKDVSTLVSSI